MKKAIMDAIDKTVERAPMYLSGLSHWNITISPITPLTRAPPQSIIIPIMKGPKASMPSVLFAE